jgi:hypothetical protein
MKLQGVREREVEVSLQLVLVQDPFGEIIKPAGIAFAASPLVADCLDFFGEEVAQSLINLTRGAEQGG